MQSPNPPISPNTNNNILKQILKRANLSLQLYNLQRHPNIWHSIYKWNYDHNLLKNLLKLTNKTLKGLNKYHVFKIDYIFMLIGMGLGYVVSQAEKGYEKVQQQLIQIQSSSSTTTTLINKLLIDNVLKDQQLANQLKQVLNQNIFTNEDIQTNLHFILINKVINPQLININKLVKSAIIDVLRSKQLQKLVQSELATGVKKNTQKIANQAFRFLTSDTMLNIITNDVAPLISSQTTQFQVSKLVKQVVNNQLKNQHNQQVLYQFLREKIIF